MYDIHPPLVAADGSTLRVLIVARISGDKQDERSLDDQERLCRETIERSTNLAADYTAIKGVGKGERLDRVEYLELQDRIESQEIDVVITEDLGRIARRSRVITLCEDCCDLGVRLIAINDQVDTGQEDWELNTYFASMRHQIYNKDLGRRIRRTHRNRFDQGGILTSVPYGYLKPPGCKNDDDLEKIPDADPIIEKFVKLLEDDATYEEVADWFASIGVPLPKRARGKRWNGRMVKTMIYNPIYKGVRIRGRTQTKRHNRTGRYRQVPGDPRNLQTRQCPHLAFIEPERYDRLIRKLEDRAAQNPSAKTLKDRKPVANKKRTEWPFPLLKCSICRRPMHRGFAQRKCGCYGSRQYRCWNGVLIDEDFVVQKLTDAILSRIEAIPDFDETLMTRLRACIDRQTSSRDHEAAKIRRAREEITTKIRHITDAIEAGRRSPSLLERLAQLEDELGKLRLQEDQLEQSAPATIKIPEMSEVRQGLRTAICDLARDSQEFFRLMARIVPVVEVHLVQRPDRVRPLPRVRVVLDLVSSLKLREVPDEFAKAVRHEFWVNLFDEPIVAQLLPEVRRLRALGIRRKEIVRRLKVPVATLQGTIRLLFKMEKLGLDTPYIPVTDPSAMPPALFRRLKHPRYRFEPLADDDARS